MADHGQHPTIMLQLIQCFFCTMSPLPKAKAFDMRKSSMVKRQNEMLAYMLAMAFSSDVLISNYHKCSVANI